LFSVETKALPSESTKAIGTAVLFRKAAQVRTHHRADHSKKVYKITFAGSIGSYKNVDVP